MKPTTESMRRVALGLSLSRIATSLLFLGLVLYESRVAHAISLIVLVAIEASDFIDGKLARRWNATSRLGYVADAYGDRAAYVAYALAAVMRSGLSPLLAYAIVVRDFGLFAARSYFVDWASTSSGDRIWSKVNGILARILLWCFLATWYDTALSWNFLGDVRASIVWLLTLTTCVYVIFSYYSLLLLVRRYKSRTVRATQ